MGVCKEIWRCKQNVEMDEDLVSSIPQPHNTQQTRTNKDYPHGYTTVVTRGKISDLRLLGNTPIDRRLRRQVFPLLYFFCRVQPCVLEHCS